MKLKWFFYKIELWVIYCLRNLKNGYIGIMLSYNILKLILEYK